MERALIHRKESIMHKSPIGIEFQYDDKKIDPKSQLPYKMKYKISTFDQEIQTTDQLFPFVKPPETIKDCDEKLLYFTVLNICVVFMLINFHLHGILYS